MKLKYDVYLAGAMHGRTVQEVIEERSLARYLCEANGITYYDPASDEGLDQMHPSQIIDLKPDLLTMEGYVKKDDAFVDQCRVLLVLTGDRASSGTLWEAGRMFYKNKRPIYLVAPKMAQGSLTNFTTVKATKIFESIGQAIKFLKGELDHAICNPRKIRTNRKQSRKS